MQSEIMAIKRRGKYKSYCVKEKIDILAKAENFGVCTTCRMYHITLSTLCSWKKPLDVSMNKSFKNVIWSLWINYMTDEGRKVREGKPEWIKAQSKQLIVDWVAAAIKSLRAKLDLVHKSFIVTGINTSLKGTDNHMVSSDTDTEHIFNDEDHNEICEGFTDEVLQWPQKIFRVLDMP